MNSSSAAYDVRFSVRSSLTLSASNGTVAGLRPARLADFDGVRARSHRRNNFTNGQPRRVTVPVERSPKDQ